MGAVLLPLLLGVRLLNLPEPSRTLTWHGMLLLVISCVQVCFGAGELSAVDILLKHC